VVCLTSDECLQRSASFWALRAYQRTLPRCDACALSDLASATHARRAALCTADGKYEAILAAFEMKKRGTYARIMVINPLHRQLPKLCIMVQARTT
jgi:hypothetical protein